VCKILRRNPKQLLRKQHIIILGGYFFVAPGRMDERSIGANSAGASWNCVQYSHRKLGKHHVLPRDLSGVYFDFSEMTYNVLIGTLNPTHSLTHSLMLN